MMTLSPLVPLHMEDIEMNVLGYLKMFLKWTNCSDGEVATKLDFALLPARDKVTPRQELDQDE